jgi:hypothetical protein
MRGSQLRRSIDRMVPMRVVARIGRGYPRILFSPALTASSR